MKLRILPILILTALTITAAYAQYNRTDLVSNQPGIAPFTDPNLVNAWGLVALPTSPWWVSDNGTGDSSLKNAMGQPVIATGGSTNFVTVPPAPSSPAGTLGTPTGIVGNISTNAKDFTITEGIRSGRSIFIFATLDGTISGWNPAVGIADPTTGATHATIAVNRSNDGAVYTGLAIATNQAGQTFLYAADGGPNRRVDRFDGTFKVKSFDDPAIPRNFTTYGIQTVNGNIWVTFTALNKAQGGFVDVFDTEGNLVRHFAAHGPLHSPSGIALASNNNFAYVINQVDNTVSSFTLSNTGTFTPTGTAVATGSSPAAIATSSFLPWVYVTNVGGSSVSMYSVNAASGVLTAIAAPVMTGSVPLSIALAVPFADIF